jgi:hypothetical protein
MNSYRNSKTSSTGNSSKSSNNNSKPFCKVCYDAGKSEREYTSHYVKNKPGNEGKVICPYLLSLVCAYCKKQEGHTAKHCPVLLAKSSSSSSSSSRSSELTVTTSASTSSNDGWTCIGERKSHNKPPVQAPAKQQPVKKTSTRAYTALSEIMEEEEEEMQKQEFPILRKNLAESPVTPPPTSGKKIVQWSTVVKSAPTKTKPIVAPAPVIVTTPVPTDKDRESFRVIPEDDYMSDEVEEEEYAAVSGSGSGYVYGKYSTTAVSSSGNWGDDIEDY